MSVYRWQGVCTSTILTTIAPFACELSGELFILLELCERSGGRVHRLHRGQCMRETSGYLGGISVARDSIRCFGFVRGIRHCCKSDLCHRKMLFLTQESVERRLDVATGRDEDGLDDIVVHAREGLFQGHFVLLHRTQRTRRLRRCGGRSRCCWCRVQAA